MGGSCFCFGSSSGKTNQCLVLPMERPETNGQKLPTFNLKRYSFADLKSMTRGFSSDAVIGEGGHVVVYMGWIDAVTLSPSMYGFGMMVAVKKFRPAAKYYLQDIQSGWRLLQRLSHPNVVKLLGYCFEDKVLIVYEFMQKGSLDKHLFDTDAYIASICWATRLRIGIGVARGLTFLHSSGIPVVHGDVNTSNMLLDGSYNPKISSLLVAQLKSEGDRDSETIVRGTGELTVKTDVYCFGVVLLEILTGVRASGGKRSSGKSLVAWAAPLISHRRNLRTVMDARLGSQYLIDAAFKAAQLALKCTRKESQTRPAMKEVLDELERIERM